MVNLFAAIVVISGPLVEQQAYPTEESAAVAAYSQIAVDSVEYIGGIYHGVDGYHYTLAVTTGNDDSISGELHFAIPRGCNLVATYHTHPRQGEYDLSEWFSHGDVTTAKDMGVHSYIGVWKTREVKLYKVGDKVEHDNHRLEGSVAYGITVGKF